MEHAHTNTRPTHEKFREKSQWGRGIQQIQTPLQLSTKAPTASHPSLSLFICHLFIHLHDSTAHQHHVTSSSQQLQNHFCEDRRQPTRTHTHHPNTLHATSTKSTVFGSGTSRTISDILPSLLTITSQQEFSMDHSNRSKLASDIT